jgi:hypothetical protein
MKLYAITARARKHSCNTLKDYTNKCDHCLTK